METIEIRVEGFNFEEVANHLSQLAEDEGVTIQIKSPSYGSSSLSLDSTAIILTAAGINLLAVVIKVLSEFLRKTGTDKDAARKKHMVFQGKDWTVSIPGNTPEKEINIKIDSRIKHGVEERLVIQIVNFEGGL